MSPTTPEPTATDGHDRPGATPAAGHGGNGGDADMREAVDERILARLLEHATDVARHVRTLASIASEQARLRLRRTRWTIVQLFVLALASAALAVGGAVYLARGLAGTLTALLGGRPWHGELAAGLLLLVLVAAGLALAMRRDEHRELERLRRKYGSDDETEQRGASRAETTNGRGAPGAGAGAGAGGCEPKHGEPGS